MKRATRAVVSGAVAVAALGWAMWAVDPTASSSPVQPIVITALMAVNVVLTCAAPRAKRAVVVAVQRYALNPVVRGLFRIGFVPFGYALLETRGRRTGLPRVVPVANGLCGQRFWIVAEHGRRADYVRNIEREPAVRVKLRRGLRFVWCDGLARVLPDDDPLARQHRVCGWHPLRWWNAATVRALSAAPLTVRVDLDYAGPPNNPLSCSSTATSSIVDGVV